MSKTKAFALALALAQAGVMAGAQPLQDAPAAAGSGHFSCGGVGQAEQERMKQDAPQHAAMVTFSTPDGAYVAGVDIRVTNASGQVVAEGACEGPLMLLDVPHAGEYTIRAGYQGQREQRQVHLGQKTAHLSFRWNAS